MTSTSPCKGASWGFSCARRSTCAHHLAWDGIHRPGDGSIASNTRDLCPNHRDFIPQGPPAPIAATAQSASTQKDLFA